MSSGKKVNLPNGAQKTELLSNINQSTHFHIHKAVWSPRLT